MTNGVHEHVVAAAVEAGYQMAASPAWQRTEWLEAVAQEVASDAEALAECIVAEGIKTIREARREVERAATTFRLAAAEVGREAGSLVALDRMPNGTGRLGISLRRPVGVVLGITPFNDPLNLVAHKVAPALAAGNAIIVKPHEKTPSAARRLLEACHRAGLPGGAVQVFEANHNEVAATISDPRVAMVSFTGGRIGGAAVARAAAGKPTSLELGGIASTIVMADAEIDQAVPLIVSGMFAAAGQNCLHVQRVLIENEVYDAVLDGLVGLTRKLRLGDRRDPATDMGRLIDAVALKRCADWVAEAIAHGARLETGGTVEGETFAPTILSNVPTRCRIVREEVFGPCTVVERFKTLDEAIASAARTGPALAAGIFTQSLDAPQRAAALPVGHVVVNDTSDFRVDHMPFGGPGAAGLGREGIADAVQAMTERVLICQQHFNIGLSPHQQAVAAEREC